MIKNEFVCIRIVLIKLKEKTRFKIIFIERKVQDKIVYLKK